MAEIDDLFARLERFKGSDLHLRPDTPPMIRVHGTLLPMKSEKLSAESVEKLLMEIVPDEALEIFKDCGEVDFAHALPGGNRLRGNVFRDRAGVSGVFRLIPSVPPSSDDVYLSPPILGLCRRSKGLVLITGPTGAGKSTTMAAMIDQINSTRKEHILTIEDPLEFLHRNKKCLITQREVRTHTRSFSSALRAALREDPDIVMVGEMRDLETTMTAIETAETGHLVFGTLHTTTASSTVDRMIDQFPADRQDQVRTMLSSILAGVVSQTLLRKKDGMGQVAAREILIMNQAIKTLIREKKTYQIGSQIETGKETGMILLNESIQRLVMSDIVSPEEALFKSMDKDDMRRRLSALRSHRKPPPTEADNG
ncbi:MAG: PilT/PilU family type 4a pilus ATPase [Elusimicrobiota bacterium]